MTQRPNGIWITGVGPVTPIGIGAEACWSGLCTGKTDVVSQTLPVDFGVAVELPVAAMPPTAQTPGLEPHLKFLADQDCDGARDLAYSLMAMQVALADAKLEFDRAANRVGMIQVFEAPGVERTVGDLFKLLSTPPPPGSPPRIYDLMAPRFYNMQPFLYVHLAAKAFGLRGFCTSVHNACSSGAFAIETAAQQIRNDHADVMIVVGGEAFETAVRLEWFRRLDLYARGAAMRPFDANPTGFYVGEGGAAIVLESANHAALRGVKPYAVYRGGAFCHQSWKQTIPDLRASRLQTVITSALNRAGIASGEIDLIVPHGAATALSDTYEASCLAAAFEGARCDAVAACFKPFFGHLLAASGIIDLIGALLCMKNQAVPGRPGDCRLPIANRQSDNREPSTAPSSARSAGLPIPMVAAFDPRRVKTVLKLSTGFTGHDAAAVFVAPP